MRLSLKAATLSLPPLVLGQSKSYIQAKFKEHKNRFHFMTGNQKNPIAENWELARSGMASEIGTIFTIYLAHLGT